MSHVLFHDARTNARENVVISVLTNCNVFVLVSYWDVDALDFDQSHPREEKSKHDGVSGVAEWVFSFVLNGAFARTTVTAVKRHWHLQMFITIILTHSETVAPKGKVSWLNQNDFCCFLTVFFFYAMKLYFYATAKFAANKNFCTIPQTL